MPEGYRHLTYAERCQIHALRKSGHSNGAIVDAIRKPEALGRLLCPLSRKRGCGKRPPRPVAVGVLRAVHSRDRPDVWPTENRVCRKAAARGIPAGCLRKPGVRDQADPRVTRPSSRGVLRRDRNGSLPRPIGPQACNRSGVRDQADPRVTRPSSRGVLRRDRNGSLQIPKPATVANGLKKRALR